MTIQVTKIVTRGNHTFFITKNRMVYATGDNANGQLGLGHTHNQKEFVEVISLKNKGIIEITAGYQHTIAISKNKRVICVAGRSDCFELGGYSEEQKKFINQEKFIEIAVDGDVTKIVAGGLHTFVLDKNGRTYAAGFNYYGQLGLIHTKDYPEFIEITSLKNKYITKIFMGIVHTFAIAKNGEAYATGCNKDGQLGLGDIYKESIFIKVTSLINKGITKIVTGYSHTFAIAKNKRIYATGHNKYGQLGLDHTNKQKEFVEVTFLRNKDITEIVAGYKYTFVVTKSWKVYAAGKNKYGQLGFGNTKEQNKFTEVPSLKNKCIVKVVTGDNHAFAMAKNGAIYVAGRNQYGQLGFGDIKNRSVFTLVPNIKFTLEDAERREFTDNLHKNEKHLDMIIKCY